MGLRPPYGATRNRANNKYIPLSSQKQGTLAYDILRIETDLREPIENLGLARDHLQVEYGPVNFTAGNMQLWLPWDAEMYMELHGKRYHHRHFLTDYLLFGVDTSHKIGLPKGVPQDVIEQEKSVPDKPQP